VTATDFALLLIRVVLGLTMAAHGYNKFFGKGGLAGTAGWFDSMGMKPGMFHARIAATTEMSAGIGLAIGLLTPIPAAGFVALMFVAAWTVHRKNGFFIVKEGWEYNLILAAAAVAVAGLGAGRLSLDYALFRNLGVYDFLGGWNGLVIAVVLGLAGGIGQLVIFYRPPAPKAE
jgi:putative oxidoreductase